MKTLYCFRLDELSGRLERYIISDYTESKLHRRYVFKYDLGRGMYKYNVKIDNVGRFVDGKLFTFNPDRIEAYKRVIEQVEEKCKKLEREVGRLNTIKLKLIYQMER